MSIKVTATIITKDFTVVTYDSKSRALCFDKKEGSTMSEKSAIKYYESIGLKFLEMVDIVEHENKYSMDTAKFMENAIVSEEPKIGMLNRTFSACTVICTLYNYKTNAVENGVELNDLPEGKRAIEKYENENGIKILTIEKHTGDRGKVYSMLPETFIALSDK